MRMSDAGRAAVVVTSTVLAAVAMALGAGTANAQEGSADPLSFLEPLIGTWVSAPEWLAERPGMEEMVPISFEWGSDRSSIVEHSGLPGAGRLGTVGLIVWDPAREQARFMASQGADDLYFEGHYEPGEGGVIRRVYRVYRPDRTSDEYRETLFPLDDGSMDWLTERREDGRFVPRGASGGPEYRIVRMPDQSIDVEARLSGWVGTWGGTAGIRLSIDRLDSGGLSIQEVEAELTSTGVLGWDPHVRALVSVAVREDGALVRGRFWTAGDGEMSRTVRVYETTGHVTGWRERWGRATEHPIARSGYARRPHSRCA